MKRSKQYGFGLLDLILMSSLMLALITILLSMAKYIAVQNTIYQEKTVLTQSQKAIASYLAKNGYSIVTTGAVPGFPQPLNPTREQLIQAGFLPFVTPVKTRFGGVLQYEIRVGLQKDLIGITCDSGPVQEGSFDSVVLASKIASGVPGGVFTSVNDPSILSGVSFKNMPSPINSPAIVCAITTAPSPL